MDKRGHLPPVVRPYSVSDDLILRCRSSIDGPLKKTIRKYLNYILKKYYKLSDLGEGFQLGWAISLPANSRLGRYGYIGKGFSSSSPISVGDLTMISTNVSIVDNDHGIDDPGVPIRLNFKWVHNITVFESDVWVGHGAILRAGITVGKGAVIGAGSVVTKDVEPYCVVAGTPAKVIKKRIANCY